MDFTDKLRLRGKADEDMYFAKLDRELIKLMHEKQALEENKSSKQADNQQHSWAAENK